MEKVTTSDSKSNGVITEKCNTQLDGLQRCTTTIHCTVEKG